MSVAVPVRPVATYVAVMVVVPAETAVAIPCDGVTLLITAIAVLEVDQVTNGVRFGGQVGVAAE